MSKEEIIRRYAERVGYSDAQVEKLSEGNHRVRHISHVFKAAPLNSIVAEVVRAEHCNSGYKVGDRFVLDVDGNFISKLCPKRLCVYLISQLTIPVGLINERLSEGLEPNDFHFMRNVRCPDVGVDCSGYGEVMLRVSVVSREKYVSSPNKSQSEA